MTRASPGERMASLEAGQEHLRELLAQKDRKDDQRADSLGRLIEDMRDDIRRVTETSTETLDRSRLRDIDLADMRRELGKLADAVKAMRPDVEIVASARRGLGLAKRSARWAIYFGAAMTGFAAWWNDWWPTLKAWLHR